MFRLPSGIRAKDIRDLLYSVDPAHIEGLLRLAMKRTALFKYKIVQIAKKFGGAIDAQADYERISIHRLLETFEGTPIQTETYRELFTTIMDVKEAALLVQQIQSGDTEVVIAPPFRHRAGGSLRIPRYYPAAQRRSGDHRCGEAQNRG
ncbi:hypothetical protein [Methanogenium cariaci]|uniref:hypothetical protein n=1 Tax=Methanogenium cariaci TaxID=2197 RepID=UPI00248121B3|nr:hypothetical protein [Methanogenium cariaci]